MKMIMTIRRFAALLAASMSLATAGQAAPPPTEACSEVKRLPDGMFTFQPKPGLSLLETARQPGPFVYRHDGDVVAFSCVRARALPQVDDVEILQAGFELFLAGWGTGMRMLKLSIDQGRVRYEVTDGSLSAAEQKELNDILAAMQARTSSRT
jgi:hypothetical protein